MQGLVKLSGRYPIIDIRGRGLMVAVEFGGKDGSFKAETGTATAMVKACAAHSMLLLSAGELVLSEHLTGGWGCPAWLWAHLPCLCCMHHLSIGAKEMHALLY